MPLLTQMLPQFVPMLRDSINTRLKQKNVGGGIKLGKKNMKRPGVQELAPCRLPRAAAAAATVAGLAWLGSGSLLLAPSASSQAVLLPALREAWPDAPAHRVRKAAAGGDDRA